MTNSTRLTQNYIAENPYIKECLRRGLINYSALAREICKEHKTRKLDAVIMACRRYRNRMKSQVSTEKAIKELLRKSRLKIRSKMAVITVETPSDIAVINSLRDSIKRARGDFNAIEGDDVVTIISNEEFVPAITKTLGSHVLKIREGLVQVTMIFNRKIESTPGVVSRIFGLLFDAGVNVIEEMSCWTEVMLILTEKDFPKALSTLDVDPVVG